MTKIALLAVDAPPPCARPPISPQYGTLPFDIKTVFVLPIGKSKVVLVPVWYGTLPLAPPLIFVAVLIAPLMFPNTVKSFPTNTSFPNAAPPATTTAPVVVLVEVTVDGYISCI